MQDKTKTLLINRFFNFMIKPNRICGKTFFHKAILKSHIKNVHLNEGTKDHICDTCGQAFKFLQTLKTHVKYVHDKVKEHVCELCNKRFARITDKNTHIKKVHQKQ